MRLVSVRIEGFKAIKDTTVDLTDATAIVGPNNAGKSSVLQAVHFASRAMAQASEPNKQSTLSLREIEYIPSMSYRDLGNLGTWGNVAGTPESRVTFNFVDPSDGSALSARVVLKSARNEGISVNPRIPNKLIPYFRGRDVMFSAYIPGIAGIPLTEEMLSVRHIFRKAASGDSNVVLRNILNLINLRRGLAELRSFVRDVYPEAFFDVNFSDKNDLYIKSNASTGRAGFYKPLEFSGTGFLQVLQIFSYLVLFRPKILLIDEPESHLHPTLQTRLVRALQKRAADVGAVVLITSHSPFVVRGLSLGSKTIWIDGGNVLASDTDGTIRDALGWGALDRRILICTEDTRLRWLSEIIGQDDSLSDKIGIFPFDGVSKLGSGTAIARLRESLGGQHRIIVHRDRDCHSDEELTDWVKQYADHGIETLVTEGSDIEMYFCSAEYVASALGIDLPDAQSFIGKVYTENEENYKRTFIEKRSQINKKIYEKKGGSPSTQDMWDELPLEQKVRGKDLIGGIRGAVQAAGHNEKRIGYGNGVTVAGGWIQQLRAWAT